MTSRFSTQLGKGNANGAVDKEIVKPGDSKPELSIPPLRLPPHPDEYGPFRPKSEGHPVTDPEILKTLPELPTTGPNGEIILDGKIIWSPKKPESNKREQVDETPMS